MTTVPRKLYKWFDRLDLTYSIRNITRDLANGFLVAEILSRYLPEIKMYQFYNGLSMDKRKDNWQRIVKVLDSHGKTFTKYDYEPVMFLAKGAAYEFIKELYAFLEKDEIIETRKQEKKKTPYYLKPTATLLMKDTELNRIIDNKERFNEKVSVLRYHYAKARAEKQDLNLEEFINKQKQEMLKKNAKRLFTSKNKNKAIEPQQNEPKLIVLKNLEGNKKKNKENQETHDSDAITEALDTVFTSLFDREDNKRYLHLLPSTLVESKNEKEIRIIHLLKRTYEYPPELVQKLLEALNKSTSEIKDALSNSYKDFRSFIIYILQFLENLETNTILYELLKTFISKLGKMLVEEQPNVTSLFMENEGLKQITEMAQNVSNKRDMLAHIIISFTPKNSDAHYRILEKLASSFKSDLKNLSSVLAHISCYCDEEIDSRIFDFYFYKAIKIIHFSYPTMKANGLKILNEISKFNKSKIYLVSDNLQRLADESWWEIKAQILIICANQLEYIENHDKEHEHNHSQEVPDHNDIVGGEDDMSAHEAKFDSHDEEHHDNSEHLKSGETNHDHVINSSVERSGLRKTDLEDSMVPTQQYIQKLIDIINKIFHIHQNINVQKVGLIYLAKILNYYPELCETYLAVLLTINDEVKSSILNNDEAYNIESHIVLTSNSFKYYQTGASLIWNSSGLASALNDYVKNERLDAFEFKHIEILAGCFVREIYSEDKEKWLEIYSDLQKYIFISLTASDQCKIASHIIKKVFLNQDLCDTVMETSKDLFLTIMKLIYQPDIEEECKENILELFKFLVSESEVYKEYVYQIIKRFSEKSHSRFLRTNIIQFMNELARERRTKLFGENTLETLSF